MHKQYDLLFFLLLDASSLLTRSVSDRKSRHGVLRETDVQWGDRVGGIGGQVTSYSTIRQKASYDKDINNLPDDLSQVEITQLLHTDRLIGRRKLGNVGHKISIS